MAVGLLFVALFVAGHRHATNGCHSVKERQPFPWSYFDSRF
jgi:hypothetical protein